MKRLFPFGLLCFFTLLFAACSYVNSNEKVSDIVPTSKSKEAVASFRQGLLFADQADGQKARAAFIKAIEQDPKMAIAYIFKASTDFSPKEFADDMNKAKANLDGASEWEKVYYDYNMTFFSPDYNKRLELAQKMATRFPDAARAQVELGSTYASGNENAKARESFQKAVALNPNWVGGYSALVNDYLFSEPKDFNKAEQNALKAVELAPASPGMQIALGDCYRAQNNLEKARDAYAKAIQLDPNSPVAYYKKGHANSFLGNLDEARQNYKDGATHDEVKFGEVANTGNTYLYANDYKMAMRYLTDECAKMDASGETKDRIIISKLNCLDACTRIAMHNGDIAKLKEFITMTAPLATEVTNDLGTAQARLFQKADEAYWQAIVNAMEGNFDAAKSKAEENKTTLEPVRDPNKLNNYEFAMGYINFKQKNYADAITRFEKSNPSNLVYNRYWLAMANEAAGNKDKATAQYKEIAQYNFNEVGYALIRNEVKKKIAAP
jgi:tetratricopeptide (TPR) repeat protein